MKKFELGNYISKIKPIPGALLSFLLFMVALLVSVKHLKANEIVDDKYAIICTTGMISDMVKQVAGSRGTVRGLIGAGIDPHLYKPTRTDIAALMSADVIFYNGLLLEGKMTDALIRAAMGGKKVFAVTELMKNDELLEPEEFAGMYDPHVWMDPLAWSKAVIIVRDKLSEYDKTNTAYYHKNAESLLEKLKALHAYANKSLGSVPEDSRVLVTAHDAFNYFGKRYNFEVVGIQGMSTESEAGVRDIEEIVNLLVTRKIKAVFVESTVSERNIRALIQGANARNHSVRIGGNLFSDAMGQAGTYEGTYIGMIDHNVTVITQALGGTAPVGGMQGLLRRQDE